MKIPGLDEITANMNKFADMLPVLQSLDNNLRLLLEYHLDRDLDSEFTGGQHRDPENIRRRMT